jgi:hypothetical protein
VGIGMEQPVADDHLQHGTGPDLGNALAIDAGGIDRLEVDAGDPVPRIPGR